MGNPKGIVACNRLDLTGLVFGRLTATGKTETRGKVIFWECRCECGNSSFVRSQSLREGLAKHCGCSTVRGQTATHRMSHTPTYQSWLGMKARCGDETNDVYGAAGVSVCERWQNSFENFLADMGLRPPGHSIDRIKNELGYEPSNCRWATRMVQGDNRRVVRRFDALGEKLSLAQLSRRTGIKYATLYKRIITSGWSVGRALQGGLWSRAS